MKELILGREGLEFLQWFLDGGDDLAKAASTQMQEGDRILTWLPDDLVLADVSLREGLGHQEPPDEDIWKPLRLRMREYLERDPNHVVVVESGFMQPASVLPNWVTFEEPPNFIPYFCCDGGIGYRSDSGERKEVHDLVSVFGFLNGTTASASQVSELIRSTFPFHEIHVLTFLPDGERLESGATINRALLFELGRRAEYISVGAYDGTGVVLWKRTGQELVR